MAREFTITLTEEEIKLVCMALVDRGMKLEDLKKDDSDCRELMAKFHNILNA